MIMKYYLSSAEASWLPEPERSFLYVGPTAHPITRHPAEDH